MKNISFYLQRAMFVFSVQQERKKRNKISKRGWRKDRTQKRVNYEETKAKGK